MSHYSALLRSHYTKTIVSSSTNNNENDENATIKNLICKQISKVQQTSNGSKGTMRGILGEVGNMTLSNKPMISKPKLIQQQTAIATIIESKSSISVLPPAPSPPATIVENEVEEIMIDDDDDDDDLAFGSNDEFDCDSGDSHNITTV